MQSSACSIREWWNGGSCLSPCVVMPSITCSALHHVVQSSGVTRPNFPKNFWYSFILQTQNSIQCPLTPTLLDEGQTGQPLSLLSLEYLYYLLCSPSGWHQHGEEFHPRNVIVITESEKIWLATVSFHVYAITFQSINWTWAGNKLLFTFSFTFCSRYSSVGNKNKAQNSLWGCLEVSIKRQTWQRWHQEWWLNQP